MNEENRNINYLHGDRMVRFSTEDNGNMFRVQLKSACGTFMEVGQVMDTRSDNPILRLHFPLGIEGVQAIVRGIPAVKQMLP